jgi:Outer membrane protein beta-barrel domain
MRNQLKITFFALFIFASSQAQIAKFGIKAGLNYANFNNTEIQTKAITSYHAGLTAELKISDGFALQPELLYTTQGASYDNGVQEFKNELGYIAIPVLAKIYLSKSLSLELGPQASFLLKEKNKFAVNDSKTFDFSLAAGLGLKITKSIFIQGRYTLGLSEANINSKAKNSVLALGVGINL